MKLFVKVKPKAKEEKVEKINDDHFIIKVKEPFFSIIIPTKNEEENLSILLASLVDQTEKDFEVIVVDSFSTDKTPQIVKNFQNKISPLFLVR